MTKLLGAALILGGCVFLGLYTASLHRTEANSLRRLIGILDYIDCELQYKLSSLPDLCRQAARDSQGALRKLFILFADEMDSRLYSDVRSCMIAAVAKFSNLPELTKKSLLLLGSEMGKFDLPGQIKSLESVRAVCRKHLNDLEANKDIRLRTYQTLSICAGAALVIILI